MSVPLVLSGSDVPSQVTDVITSSIDEQQAEQKYSCKLIAECIQKKDAHNVCFQFPDHLVCDSVPVVNCIKKHLRNEKYICELNILADSSYSPCCVDCVAAEHAGADLILHFGNACLTETKGTPVVYILENKLLDQAKLKATLEQLSKEHPTTIIYAELQLYNFVKTAVKSLGCDNLLVVEPARGEFLPEIDNGSGSENTVELFKNFRVAAHDPEQTHVIYVTDGAFSDSLLLYFSTKYCSVRTISSSHLDQVHEAMKWLKLRYRIVMQARSAGTIGILANTLGTASILEDVQEIANVIKRAGKKHYVFVVGKPNVPKLANFEAIDMWTVLGCPVGGQILDSQDYYKPIITPYELLLALNDSWNGTWDFDYKRLLQDENELEHQDESDEPLFDLVTGRMTTKHNPLKSLSIKDSNSTESSLQTTSASLAIRNTVSTAADYLNNTRTWKGLGQGPEDSDEEEKAEFSAVKKGRSGTARDYSIVE